MENNVELRPCIGTVIGTERDPEPQTITWDQDEIWCNGRRIGYVSHKAGSLCRFQRILTKQIGDGVVTEVKKLREAAGGNPISDEWVGLPEPSTIKKALNSPKRKR